MYSLCLWTGTPVRITQTERRESMGTFETVAEIIRDQLAGDVEIEQDTELTGDLALEEMDAEEICSAIEYEFGVSISVGRLLRFETAGDLAAYIDAKME